MNTSWSDVLGNNVTASVAYRQYLAEHKEGETLAEWIQHTAAELWPGETVADDVDFDALAAQLEREAQESN